MKRISTVAATIGAVALLAAGSAFAGGATCGTGAKESSAKSASAGHHCEGKDASEAMAKSCGVKANQAIYSFAVPTVHCEDCVHNIQTALMAQKGVACAHVDLTNHVAYIIADKSVNQKAVAKTISTAGYKNSFKGQGSKVQAEFAKAMASGEKGSAACSANKDKDKI
jgi:copper chaperone CopZ